MFSSSSPVSLNLIDMFLDNDEGYGQQFLSYSPEEVIGHPLMLMESSPFRLQDYSESQELQEVLAILQPRSISQESLGHSHSSTDQIMDQAEDYVQTLKKKVKPNAGDEPCCACPKSKCLKLYCVCLQRNNYCGKDCSCKGCFNDIWHEEERQKVLETEKFKNLFIGCRCKRSKCQQKYCECYINGKPCGKACKCKGCKNQSHSHNHPHNKKSEVDHSQNNDTLMA